MKNLDCAVKMGRENGPRLLIQEFKSLVVKGKKTEPSVGNTL